MISLMKLNLFTRIGWDEKTTLTIPTGATYEEIILESNLTPAQINKDFIRIPKSISVRPYYSNRL